MYTFAPKTQLNLNLKSTIHRGYAPLLLGNMAYDDGQIVVEYIPKSELMRDRVREGERMRIP